MQSIPFYPFAIASLGTGIVGLIPYLALREPNTEFTGEKDTLLKMLDSHSTGIALTLFTLGLLVYALFAGDWGEFWQLFTGDRFLIQRGLGGFPHDRAVSLYQRHELGFWFILPAVSNRFRR